MKIFDHTFEIFNSDLLVIIGAKDGEQIDKWLKKNGSKSAKTLLNKKNVKELTKVLKANGHAGFMYQAIHDDTKEIFFFLSLQEFKNDWHSLEILMHELVHYKQMQFENKVIKGEHEFEAYFIESCFRSLRKRLFKELKL